MKELKQVGMYGVRETARLGRISGALLVALLLFGLLWLSAAPTEAKLDEVSGALSGAMVDVGREELSQSQPLSGSVPLNARWLASDNDDSSSVAWGDVDSDGDLDLVVGNYLGSNKLYLNERGTLAFSASSAPT